MPNGAEAGLMRAAWRTELLRGLSVLLLATLVGWLFDAPRTCLALGLFVYLGQHLRNLRWLSRWVEHPKRIDLPEPGGIWGEIFEQLLVNQRRNRKRKKRLAGILAEFQASTAALPDGAVVLARRGQIVWFNNAAQALLGLRSPQDFGQRIPNLLRHPEFTEYFQAGDYSHDLELPSPVKAETSLSVRIIPYGDNQRLMIVRDVSEIRRMEVARRDFVANASHELRTPLTVLRGYLDMMEPDATEGGRLDGWQGPIQEMRAQASRMESLISDMLKLARLEADVVQSRQELIDMPRVLSGALESARGLSRERHRIEAEVDPGLRLYGRESELHSLATNLLSNAVHYTPDGGTIGLRGWSDDTGAYLEVRDSGIGIDAKDLPRLTERFYRVDVSRSREQGGTGLGLAIVKHALEHHEGQLQVQSEAGKGSRFLCHFPSHRAHRAARNAVNG